MEGYIGRINITSPGVAIDTKGLGSQEASIINYLRETDTRVEQGLAFNTLRSRFGYHGVAQFNQTLRKMAKDGLIILETSRG